MGKSLLILNPRSGRGAGARDRNRILAALSEAGVDFDLVETDESGHGIEIAAEGCRQGYQRVIAAGGDGTIHEALNGILHSSQDAAQSPILAPFPVGSANDFAAMLGYPTAYGEIARKIGAGKYQAIDVGTAVVQTQDTKIERYFGNNVGMGFEAMVTLESNGIERLSGTALYAVAALRALRKFQAPAMEVEWINADGHEQVVDDRVFMVSVGNSARTGGGFYLNPTASMDDGVLDMALAKNLAKWQVLFLLPQVMWGKHTNHSAVIMARFTSLHVMSSHPIPVHLDGEVVAEDGVEIEIKIRPGILRVSV